MQKIKKLLLTLVFFASVTILRAQVYDVVAIRAAIDSQIQTYPASTLKDIYKNFFQDAFGPGHLMSKSEDAEARMRRYLENECESAKNDDNRCPDYELTGWHGRFYRVNLSVINDGRIPLETFLKAFMQSAAQFTLPKVEDWSREWQVILKEASKLDLPDFAKDSAAIQNLLDQGQYASHHSKQYNEQYHPHYRLIERGVFEEQLLPLLKK